MMMLLVLLGNLSFIVFATAWVPTKEHRATTTVSTKNQAPITISSLLPLTSTTSLSLVTASQTAVLDGAEWVSFQECWNQPKKSTSSNRKTKFGYVNVVVGTIVNNNNDDSGSKKQQQQKRVIGVQASEEDSSGDNRNVVALSNQVFVYRDSLAVVPTSIKDADAISTFVASMSVHCCLPKIENVGGSSSGGVLHSESVDGTTRSDTASFVIHGSKVVVLGGSDFACFAAEGLATLGATVSLVSTRSPKIRHPNVQVLTPAVGELQLGFCAVVGQFDALLDTLHDERKKSKDLFYNQNDEDGDDDGDLEYAAITASVLPLLAQRHSCTRYFSTLTQAQKLVREGGVLFGPRQADDHVKIMAQQLETSPTTSRSPFQYVGPSPGGLGNTVQTLLDRGVVFFNTAKKIGSSKTAIYARGWSLSDFWEYTTWPRDTAGDIRYGFPVLTESEFGLMRTAASQAAATMQSRQRLNQPVESQVEGAYPDDDSGGSVSANPFVSDIVSIEELQRDIVSAQRDCVLFLSASYCRTCRTIQPAFTRLARTTSEETADDLLFAKADTSGTTGKELGRALAVASVPTFLLFRKGRQYGSPLSIAKLPSKKLNLAISLLTQGLPWDDAAFTKLEEGGTTKK